jgi:hypothetical protein
MMKQWYALPAPRCMAMGVSKSELEKFRSQPIFIIASFASLEAAVRCAATMARFRFSGFPHVTSLAVS